MKKHEFNTFTYTKPNGDMSEREVFIISSPTDLYFGIDISEYSEADREVYRTQIMFIHNEYMNAMKAELEELGVSSNYRNFKQERIS